MLSATTNRRMNTTRIKVSETSRLRSSFGISVAVEQLMRGKVIAHPTETVYGICAKVKTVETFCELQGVKDRPFNRPLQIMVPNGKVAMRVVDFNETAFQLSHKFLPGPLTIIMNRNANGIVPNYMAMLIAKYGEGMSAERMQYLTTLVPRYDTVGIRTPENPVMREILERAMDNDETPIASTSANTTNAGSNRTAEEVLKHLGGKISMILDAGETVGKVASTVVRVTDERNVIIEREGAIHSDEIVNAARPARVWKRIVLPVRISEAIDVAGTEFEKTDVVLNPGKIQIMKKVNSLLILA